MIVIIGGGVFGLAIGWYLARAGRAVTLLEKERIGQSASWAAAGMLMPWKLSDAFDDDLFALQQASYRQWPEFTGLLQAASGVDLGYQTNGRYFVALMAKAASRLHRQYEFHRDLGFPVEWLSGDEVRQREPNLGAQVLAAIFTPMAHDVDNRQLIPALGVVFRQAGGFLREETAVREILVKAGRVQGVRVKDEVLPAETVIVAAGAWSGHIPGLPQQLRDLVRPRKGQSLILQMAPAAPLLKQPVLGPVYLVPRPDGRLIIGATVEREAGFDTRSTAGGVYHMLRKAQAMVPAIGDLPLVEMSAGLRPTGPDRLPVLGSTSIDGLLLATGGHAYGILLAPVVAQAISRLAMTGETSPLIRPFVPGDNP